MGKSRDLNRGGDKGRRVMGCSWHANRRGNREYKGSGSARGEEQGNRSRWIRTKCAWYFHNYANFKLILQVKIYSKEKESKREGIRESNRQDCGQANLGFFFVKNLGIVPSTNFKPSSYLIILVITEITNNFKI